jgi:hypothetical protein
MAKSSLLPLPKHCLHRWQQKLGSGSGVLGAILATPTSLALALPPLHACHACLRLPRLLVCCEHEAGRSGRAAVVVVAVVAEIGVVGAGGTSVVGCARAMIMVLRLV